MKCVEDAEKEFDECKRLAYHIFGDDKKFRATLKDIIEENAEAFKELARR